MVKREQVVPGFVVQVNKLPPGPPGPRFTGKFALHEKLDVQSKPYSQGGLNLVKVKREKTDQVIELYYAFITNFCRPEGKPQGVKRSPKAPAKDINTASTLPAPADEATDLTTPDDNPDNEPPE